MTISNNVNIKTALGDMCLQGAVMASIGAGIGALIGAYFPHIISNMNAAQGAALLGFAGFMTTAVVVFPGIIIRLLLKGTKTRLSEKNSDRLATITLIGTFILCTMASKFICDQIPTLSHLSIEDTLKMAGLGIGGAITLIFCLDALRKLKSC